VHDDAGRDAKESSIRYARANAMHHFVAIFEQGMREGVFRPFDPALGAEVFLAGMDKIYESHLISGQARPVEEVVQSVMRLLLHGIAAPGCNRVPSSTSYDKPESVN
jgi:hypothetical protein